MGFAFGSCHEQTRLNRLLTPLDFAIILTPYKNVGRAPLSVSLKMYCSTSTFFFIQYKGNMLYWIGHSVNIPLTKHKEICIFCKKLLAETLYAAGKLIQFLFELSHTCKDCITLG